MGMERANILNLRSENKCSATHDFVGHDTFPLPDKLPKFFMRNFQKMQGKALDKTVLLHIMGMFKQRCLPLTARFRICRFLVKTSFLYFGGRVCVRILF